MVESTIPREQVILPDTFKEILSTQDNQSFFSTDMREEILDKEGWTSYEYREYPHLPDINIVYEKDDLWSREYVEEVPNKVQTMMEPFGYSKEDLKSLTLYIDRTRQRYNGAIAFYNSKEREIWVKLRDRNGLEHELAHWVTLSIFNPDKRPGHLLTEGIAGWLAWHASDHNENNEYNYSKNLEQYVPVLEESEFTIDSSNYFRDPLSTYIRATLIEVLYKHAGNNSKILGEQWRSAANFSSTSEWLASLGYSQSDINQIESEWKTKIFANKIEG